MSDKKSNKPRRLGRGLDSLIQSAPAELDAPSPEAQPVSHEPLEIPLDDIAANPYQPRTEFDPQHLNELADSIRQEGILQPLIVTRSDNLPGTTSKAYILVAGERRLRAARQAGISAVPCILKQADERKLVEWAMIENIQREDLNPIERARGYKSYMDRFDLTQAQAAETLKQARATVANYLRLLDLPEETQKLIAENLLSTGHAKVLAGLSDNADRQVSLARRTVAEGLSVRKLEQLVTAKPKDDEPSEPTSTKPAAKPAYVRDIEQQLTETIGTKVTILPGRAKHTGRIVVEYYSLDDFDRISNSLGLEVSD
jgi:ParB family transcriptional regulator, chromosome partitioning protein